MELVSLFRTEPELSTDLDIDPFLFVSSLAMFMQQMGGGGEPSCPVS